MKFLSFLGVVSVLGLPAPRIVREGDVLTAYLFDRPSSVEEQKAIDETFLKVFSQFEEDFQHDQHNSFLENLGRSLDSYSGYTHVPNQPICDVAAPNALALRSKSAVIKSQFPGGIVGRIMNFDLAKLVDQLAGSASSSAAASGGLGGIVAMQAIMMASTMIQGVVSSAIHIIPPLIPPPVWNNQPLSCLPMITGHNCFGAILHPITVSDFVMASSTDSMVQGYIASFPQTFADKVGIAPDWLYKGCFLSYMSMHCASIFPRCLAPQSGNDPTTKAPGRLPMCFLYCISTLVACPGFWIDDVIGQCEDVSVPPACSTANFWRLDLLPPQYVSVDASAAADKECPSNDYDIAGGVIDSGEAAGSLGASTAGGVQGAAAGVTDTVKLPSPA